MDPDEVLRSRLRTTPPYVPPFEPRLDDVFSRARSRRRRRRVGGVIASTVVLLGLALPIASLMGLHHPPRQPGSASPNAINGTLIAYAGGGGAGPQIMVINPDGSGRRALTSGMRAGASSSNPWPAWDPAWSPDGTMIAFRGYWGSGCDGCYDLYLMNADGTGVQRLTHGENADTPAWSPDGRQIAFTNWAGIWLINADGTGPHRIIPPGTGGELDVGHVTWSPDGTRIAYGGGVGKYLQIFVANADGSDIQQLTSLPFGASSPSWSPGGSQIVFQARPSENGSQDELYIMNADGSQLHPLLPCTGSCNDVTPSWSPDGRLVVFTCDEALCTVRPDGTGLTRIANDDQFGEPVWQPNPPGEIAPSPSSSASAPAPLTQGTAQHDSEDGVFILTPPDWSFLVHPSGPYEPKTLFAVTNYPIEAGGECAPTRAINALPADGVLAWVIEYPGTQGNDFPPRPASFSLDPSSLANYECAGMSYIFRFQDAGRYFQVHVTFGDQASQEVRDEMLASLSSMVADLCPPATEPVAVSRSGTLSPDHGAPGDQISLSGPTGRDEDWFWSPLDKIEVWWSRSPIGIPQETADQHLLTSFSPAESCSFSVNFQVPNVPPGRYLVTVLDYFPGEGFGLAGERTFTVAR